MIPFGHAAIVTPAEVASLGPAHPEWGPLDDLREDLGAEWTYALDPDGSARFWRRDLEAERRIAAEEAEGWEPPISEIRDMGYDGDAI